MGGYATFTSTVLLTRSDLGPTVRATTRKVPGLSAFTTPSGVTDSERRAREKKSTSSCNSSPSELRTVAFS